MSISNQFLHSSPSCLSLSSEQEAGRGTSKEEVRKGPLSQGCVCWTQGTGLGVAHTNLAQSLALADCLLPSALNSHVWYGAGCVNLLENVVSGPVSVYVVGLHNGCLSGMIG